MDKPIARFNSRIHIQKCSVVTDKFRNHDTVWTHYFSCYAAIGSQNKYVIEKDSGVQIHFEQTLTFQMRYCSELRHINSTEYRIIFNGRVYNIDSVDNADSLKQTIDVRCKLEHNDRQDGGKVVEDNQG